MSTDLRLALEPIADPIALAPEWLALEGNASFFLSWDWIGLWLASLPPARSPMLLRATRAGATVGLGCLVPNQRRRRLVSYRSLHLNATGAPALDCLTVEHNGLVSAAADAPALTTALGRWFADHPSGAEELQLPGIEQPVDAAALAAVGLTATALPKPAFAVDLERVREAEGDLGALLSRNARQQMRRALRLYGERGGARLVAARSTGEALDFFAALKTLHVASWERRHRPHAFSEPFFERFHRALIERSFDRGRVELLRVSAGDESVGYLYNFRQGGSVFAYQSGFADGDGRLRPGAVSHWLAIHHAAARGDQVYDFMAGDNRLKRSLATGHYTLWWQTIRQDHLKYRLEDGARAAKRWLLGQAAR